MSTQPTINLSNVSLSYPIFGGSARSLKRDLARLCFLGKAAKEPDIISVQALKNISFSLNKGDYLGLVGRNGAGKTTLLKVLSGIYEISDGHVSVDGTISSLLGASVGLQPELNGYENITLNSVLKGYSKKQMQMLTQDIEAFTELKEFLYLPIKTYSAGMQARLAFGISTAIHPDVLLIDEVIGTGDASFMQKAKDRMHDLLRKANTLVLSTHSDDIIKQFCNKVLWLDKGEIKGFGKVDEVLAQYHASLVV